MVDIERSITTLNLSKRLENCLLRTRIFTVGDLLEYAKHANWASIPNMGVKSIQEVEALLFELQKDHVSAQGEMENGPVSFAQILNDLPWDSKHEIVRRRFQGKTLQEVGDEFRISKERVRQIVDREMQKIQKAYPSVQEDRFRIVFENAVMTKDDFCDAFHEPVSTWMYLCNRYIRCTDSESIDRIVSSELSEDLQQGLAILKIKGKASSHSGPACMCCGKTCTGYFCDACHTPENLDELFDNLKNEEPERFAKIFPDVIRSFPDEIRKAYFCLYLGTLNDERFLDEAREYISTYPLNNPMTQRVVRLWLKQAEAVSYDLPMPLCGRILQTDELELETYEAAAIFYAHVGEYKKADCLIDEMERICTGSDEKRLAYVDFATAFTRIVKLKQSLETYRTKRAYWPNDEEKRRRLALVYDAKGIAHAKSSEQYSGSKTLLLRAFKKQSTISDLTRICLSSFER